MYKGYKIIALIPAKLESTRLPYKNIKFLLNKPLFLYSVESALASKYIDEVIVSTDSDIIKWMSFTSGAKVLIRPKELCTSDSHIKETIKHTIENYPTDFVLLMNPTSPLRYDIDIFIEQFDPENYDTSASVYECKIYPWGSTSEANAQSIKPYYYDNGSLYIHKSDYILKGYYWTPYEKRRQAIVTPEWMKYEIDNELDWIIVERLMEKYKAGELK